MGLFIVYSTGLLIGVTLIALSYFLKEWDNRKRNSMVAVIGILACIGGLVVGGFDGMPISAIGIGILTVAILLFIAGNKSIIREIVFSLAILVPLAIFVYVAVDKNQGSTFIVAAKNEQLDSYLREYYDELQTKTATQGFKRFEPSEGEKDKTIVLSLGKEKKGNSLEVTGVEKQGNRTSIHVKTFYNQSTEKNPTIILILDSVGENVVIKDTDGTVYDEIE